MPSVCSWVNQFSDWNRVIQILMLEKECGFLPTCKIETASLFNPSVPYRHQLPICRVLRLNFTHSNFLPLMSDLSSFYGHAVFMELKQFFLSLKRNEADSDHVAHQSVCKMTGQESLAA